MGGQKKEYPTSRNVFLTINFLWEHLQREFQRLGRVPPSGSGCGRKKMVQIISLQPSWKYPATRTEGSWRVETCELDRLVVVFRTRQLCMFTLNVSGLLSP